MNIGMKHIALIFFLSALSLQAIPLIYNGGFEDGDLNAWRVRSYSQLEPTVVAADGGSSGNFVLRLTRPDNVFANPPGVSQEFYLGEVAYVDITFDYKVEELGALVFRVMVPNVGNGQSAVYDGERWVSVDCVGNKKYFQRSWSKDASRSTAFINLKARTALLDGDDGKGGHYSIRVPMYSLGKRTYRIDFFNPIAGTSVEIDNLDATAVN